jgi:ABC-2 type transport system ATP-binding protein
MAPAPKMTESMIKVTDLYKSYGNIQAVRGLSFQVSRGEFFGLLGPNGAGKTTTIAILCGLLEPSSGKILIDGQDFNFHSKALKTKLGLVPQDFAFYPTLSGRDNLLFFGRIYGLWGRRLEERVRAVLDIVQLMDHARDTVNTFSNGMKRRLNIAIGLLHEPEILILDEPTVGVDAQSRNAILESLQALNRTGVTLLYTTHYMEEAQRLCHRVGIIDHGQIIACDTPLALMQGLGEGLIRLELNRPADEMLLRELGQRATIKIVDDEGRRLHLTVESKQRTLKELLEHLEKRDIQINTLDVLGSNLETVFLHLTGRHLRDALM